MYSTITNFATDSKIVKKILSIDSIFRENPESNLSTSFFYSFPEVIRNIKSIEIKSAEVPINSIYPVSETNDSNYFIIKSQNKEHTIKLDSGFYDKNSIQIKINNILQNTIGLESLEYSIDPISELSQFKTSNIDNIFEFNFQIKENNTNEYKKYDQILGGYLGFRENSTYTCSKTNHIISESPFGISLQKYLFINIIEYSDDWDLDESTIEVRKYPQFDNTYTIGLVSLTNPKNSVYNTRNYYGKGTTIKKIKISLVDKYGNIVDLNNNDMSLILELKIEV
jgi:hypothetical protein